MLIKRGRVCGDAVLIATPYHDLLGHLVGLYQLGRLEELEVKMSVVRSAQHSVVIGEAHSSNLTPHGALFQDQNGIRFKRHNY